MHRILLFSCQLTLPFFTHRAPLPNVRLRVSYKTCIRLSMVMRAHRLLSIGRTLSPISSSKYIPVIWHTLLANIVDGRIADEHTHIQQQHMSKRPIGIASKNEPSKKNGQTK